MIQNISKKQKADIFLQKINSKLDEGKPKPSPRPVSNSVFAGSSFKKKKLSEIIHGG